jgi:hypothetical protein
VPPRGSTIAPQQIRRSVAFLQARNTPPSASFRGAGKSVFPTF